MCVHVLLLEILLLCVCTLVHAFYIHCYSTLCVYVHAIGSSMWAVEYFWKGKDPLQSSFCYTRLDLGPLCEFQLQNPVCLIFNDIVCVCVHGMYNYWMCV